MKLPDPAQPGKGRALLGVDLEPGRNSSGSRSSSAIIRSASRIKSAESARERPRTAMA